ncbi:hypothetical protein FJY63_14800, partial [Candidatus Sumerlaeota bacterium]|nr:hypothetical protein [Candidatus Sumerlaeota bacterium]
YVKETNPLILSDADPAPETVETEGHVSFRLTLGPAPQKAATTLVTTERLGRAKVADLPYENPDGSPLKINTDYFGNARNDTNPAPGPFEHPGAGRIVLRVW